MWNARLSRAASYFFIALCQLLLHIQRRGQNIFKLLDCRMGTENIWRLLSEFALKQMEGSKFIRYAKKVRLQSYMENQIKVQQAYLKLYGPALVVHSELSLLPPEDKKEENLLPKDKEEEVRKNFKWSYEEHAKYVHFMEMNKLKVKSKLVRKSNAFFREMENYIKTKTSIQCRSHHQKFEEKYKFPHRIITGQKKHIPAHIYQAILEEHARTNYNPQIDYYTAPVGLHSKPVQKLVEGVEVGCQTEICDVRVQYGLRGVQNQQQEMGRQIYYSIMGGYGMRQYAFPFIF